MVEHVTWVFYKCRVAVVIINDNQFRVIDNTIPHKECTQKSHHLDVLQIKYHVCVDPQHHRVELPLAATPPSTTPPLHYEMLAAENKIQSR